MDKLAKKIQHILDNWDTITDQKGAIAAALYVSERKLNKAEIERGRKLYG